MFIFASHKQSSHFFFFSCVLSVSSVKLPKWWRPMVNHLQRKGLSLMLKPSPPSQNGRRRRLRYLRLWPNLMWPPLLQQGPQRPFLRPFLRACRRRPEQSNRQRTCLRWHWLRCFQVTLTTLWPNHLFLHHQRRWVLLLLQLQGLLCL